MQSSFLSCGSRTMSQRLKVDYPCLLPSQKNQDFVIMGCHRLFVIKVDHLQRVMVKKIRKKQSLYIKGQIYHYYYYLVKLRYRALKFLVHVS